MAIAAQQHAKIVKPAHDALQLDAVHEEYGEWNFVFTNKIEKRILQVRCTFDRHGFSILFVTPALETQSSYGIPAPRTCRKTALLESKATAGSKLFF
jgi:hypothetical protein